MKIVGLFILMFMNNLAFSQVISANPKKEVSPEKVKKVKSNNKDSVAVMGTSLYVKMNFSNAFRTLKENGDLYGEPLDERAHEQSLNLFSYGFGFRNQFHKNLRWEAGFSYFQNGEKYQSNLPDTSFSYETKYRYLGMPIQLKVVFGQRLRYTIGGGLQPGMFMRYLQESTFENNQGKTESSTFKTKSGYNTMVVNAIVSMGIEYSFHKKWSVALGAEARWQLNSTYTKTAAYQHKAYAYGADFGLIYHLK